jgi:hypothetical protein
MTPIGILLENQCRDQVAKRREEKLKLWATFSDAIDKLCTEVIAAAQRFLATNTTDATTFIYGTAYDNSREYGSVWEGAAERLVSKHRFFGASYWLEPVQHQHRITLTFCKVMPIGRLLARERTKRLEQLNSDRLEEYRAEQSALSTEARDICATINLCAQRHSDAGHADFFFQQDPRSSPLSEHEKQLWERVARLLITQYRYSGIVYYFSSGGKHTIKVTF